MCSCHLLIFISIHIPEMDISLQHCIKREKCLDRLPRNGKGDGVGRSVDGDLSVASGDHVRIEGVLAASRELSVGGLGDG